MNYEIVKVIEDTSLHNGTRYTEVSGWICLGYKLDENYLFYICDKVLCLSTEFYVNKEGYYVSTCTIDMGEISGEIKDGAEYIENFIAEIKSLSLFDYLTSNNYRKAFETNGKTYIDFHLTNPIIPYKTQEGVK